MRRLITTSILAVLLVVAIACTDPLAPKAPREYAPFTTTFTPTVPQPIDKTKR